MRMLPRCDVTSASMFSRSSRENREADFWGLRITATMTESKKRATRSITSR
jgi:hypothetical protein